VVQSSVWPLYHTVWFSIANLIAGNSVILKPSENTTLVVLRLVECLRRAHPLWEHVQVIAGDRELGRRLVCHEAVSSVIFQGTFEVGMRVRQDTLSQPGKEVLLYLGAKNPVVLLGEPGSDDQDRILRDAFLGAGQNCLSASQLWVKRDLLPSFLDSFHDRCKAFRIGGPGEDAFMGPLIGAPVMDRYFKFIGISEREGAEIVMRGKAYSTPGKGHFVTPTLALFDSLSPDQMRKSVSLQTEILAPHLSLVAFQDEEELEATLSKSGYGHSAVIYGEERQARALATRLTFGRIGISRGFYDFPPLIRSQAFKRSGNHALSGLGLIGQLSRSRWTG
jgi:succinylglutamic semialdehyde dehydrogenase